MTDGTYEDVTQYDLDADVEEQLLLAHNECTFIWANKEGWPVGVIMSYVWRKGSFWLTATSQRARIHAVRRDPRVCIVVTSTGSPLPRNKAITWKGMCTIHEDRETKDWFYPDFARHANSPAPTPEAFVAFLDTPARVIIEVVPELTITFDGGVMRDTTSEALASQG